MGNSTSNGKIGFLDRNEREVESIQMKRIHNGEWMTTNQVLVSKPSKPNRHIVKTVNQQSERIKDQQIVADTALQRQKMQ